MVSARGAFVSPLGSFCGPSAPPKKSRQHSTLSSNPYRLVSLAGLSPGTFKQAGAAKLGQDRSTFMKLITALSTAAFVLTPAVAFAGDASSNNSASQMKPTTTDQSARQQDRNKAYPYPDWPAIAKTAEPSPKKGADQQKAAEESASSGSKDEPSLLEKAGRALETITGRSATKEGSSQEGPAAVDQSARQQNQQDMKATGAKAAEEGTASGTKCEPSLLEKAGRAVEPVTGRSTTTKEGASQTKSTAADQNARQQDIKAASDKSYPYPDWPAVAKTEPASQGSKE
jgi:hypothetical protein